MSKGKSISQIQNNESGLPGQYRTWFLDYASYVILERAVPAIEDGLKPVQRRILHAMKEMDDGRFNKVANVIGQTMQYHPHGDASIGDALVNIGQKDLLIETQGNWGDVRTGDSLRLSPEGSGGFRQEGDRLDDQRARQDGKGVRHASAVS